MIEIRNDEIGVEAGQRVSAGRHSLDRYPALPGSSEHATVV